MSSAHAYQHEERYQKVVAGLLTFDKARKSEIIERLNGVNFKIIWVEPGFEMNQKVECGDPAFDILIIDVPQMSERALQQLSTHLSGLKARFKKPVCALASSDQIPYLMGHTDLLLSKEAYYDDRPLSQIRMAIRLSQITMEMEARQTSLINFGYNSHQLSPLLNPRILYIGEPSLFFQRLDAAFKDTAIKARAVLTIATALDQLYAAENHLIIIDYDCFQEGTLALVEIIRKTHMGRTKKIIVTSADKIADRRKTSLSNMDIELCETKHFKAEAFSFLAIQCVKHATLTAYRKENLRLISGFSNNIGNVLAVPYNFARVHYLTHLNLRTDQGNTGAIIYLSFQRADGSEIDSDLNEKILSRISRGLRETDLVTTYPSNTLGRYLLFLPFTSSGEAVLMTRRFKNWLQKIKCKGETIRLNVTAREIEAIDAFPSLGGSLSPPEVQTAF